MASESGKPDYTRIHRLEWMLGFRDDPPKHVYTDVPGAIIEMYVTPEEIGPEGLRQTAEPRNVETERKHSE